VRRKGKTVIISCRKEKRWVFNQQFIAIEEEFKEKTQDRHIGRNER
jgi:hypothetical protein